MLPPGIRSHSFCNVYIIRIEDVTSAQSPVDDARIRSDREVRATKNHGRCHAQLRPHYRYQGGTLQPDVMMNAITLVLNRHR